jgi:hypothetical protein
MEMKSLGALFSHLRNARAGLCEKTFFSQSKHKQKPFRELAQKKEK